MVNILWVTPFAPDFSGGGGQIRQAHLLVALSTRAEVQLICAEPVTDPDVRSALARIVEVERVSPSWRDRYPWLRRTADVGASLIHRPPIEVRAFRRFRQALRPACVRALRAEGGDEPDLVIVEFAGLAPLLPRWPSSSRRSRHAAPWVLTFQNLPSRMATHQYQIAPHRRQRWLLHRDAKAAVAFERRVTTAYDAVVTCTEQDKAALPTGARVLVVPNGADTDRFEYTPLPSSRRIVFTAALYTAPNIDGSRWFCREVMPLIRRAEPAAQVEVVGGQPAKEVRELGELPGVTLHVDVATVAPYLQAARVAVVPIRVGSGSRLKALEALAVGRPIVGTSIGLEGLDLRPDEHVLVADDPVEFAAAVVRLLRDDALATRLAAAGRAEVERRFTWSLITAAFTDSILSVAKAGRAGQTGQVTSEVANNGG